MAIGDRDNPTREELLALAQAQLSGHASGDPPLTIMLRADRISRGVVDVLEPEIVRLTKILDDIETTCADDKSIDMVLLGALVKKWREQP